MLTLSWKKYICKTQIDVCTQTDTQFSNHPVHSSILELVIIVISTSNLGFSKKVWFASNLGCLQVTFFEIWNKFECTCIYKGITQQACLSVQICVLYIPCLYICLSPVNLARVSIMRFAHSFYSQIKDIMICYFKSWDFYENSLKQIIQEV